jgi:hypothetical protein
LILILLRLLFQVERIIVCALLIHCVLLLLPHPQQHLLLVSSLMWIDFTKLVDSLTIYLLLSTYLYIKEVLKSLEVEVSWVWRLKEFLIIEFFNKSHSLNSLIEFDLFFHLVLVLCHYWGL